MRFECGIENRFECSMCQKRFPYKQNVAIHLKRKHKLQLDNADDMIARGHITLLPGAKNDENSWDWKMDGWIKCHNIQFFVLPELLLTSNTGEQLQYKEIFN